MRKIILSLIFLFFLSCPVDINLECVFEHTATVVKLESGLLGESEEVLIHFLWTFTLGAPSGDAIIIERSIDDSISFTTIDTLWEINQFMSYYNDDSTLQKNSTYYYRFGLLDNNEVDHLGTIEVTTPGSQHFYQPSTDTLSDTLKIFYAQLQNFNDCFVAVYRVRSIEPESLLALTNALFDTTLTYPDTSIIVYMADSLYPDTVLYAVKLSSIESTVSVNDVSIGLRAFFKKP